MRSLKLIAALSVLLTYLPAAAQPLDEEYPRRFTSPTTAIDIVYAYPGVDRGPYKVDIYPEESLGTDGYRGIVTYACIGNDTLALPYRNFPFEQRTTVRVDTPEGEARVVFRYNGITDFFTKEYMAAHLGRALIEVPEVYELANIIWCLAPVSSSDTTLHRRGEYWERVEAHFTPWLDHPVFAAPGMAEDGGYFSRYSDFRENSFTYRYEGDEIVKSDTYFYVTGDNWDDHRNLFGELLPLVRDFAEKSKFREFYAANRPYYGKQISRLETLMPVRGMWEWLEKEFPGNDIQSYKTVFSPLIGGTHSTQRFSTFIPERGERFTEGVFFICGPERYDDRNELTESERIALASGVVFTEIDHNYVNPTSDGYGSVIDGIFGDREFWSGPAQINYNSPRSVFNEYMTHAVFCLWLSETFDAPVADLAVGDRDEMNADRRGFVRFREFRRALTDLRRADGDKTVAELYPLILEWCNTFKNN